MGAFPGSLSEGAAERSEAEGVSWVKMVLPTVFARTRTEGVAYQATRSEPLNC